MTEFEAVGVLEKASHPLPRRARPELRYLHKRDTEKRKDEVWASCQILGSYPETEFWDVWAGRHPLGRLTLKPDKWSLHHGSASDETAGWNLARKRGSCGCVKTSHHP